MEKTVQRTLTSALLKSIVEMEIALIQRVVSYATVTQAGQKKKMESLEKGWNPTPLRYRPAELRGLKPKTPEPWAIDEEFYQRKTGSFEHEYNSRGAYDDRSALSASKGYEATYHAPP